MKGQRLSTNAVLGQNMCYIYSRIRNLGQKMRFGNILLEGFWKHTLLARMNSFPISPALFPSRSTLSTTLHLFPEGQKTLWLLQETVKSDMDIVSSSFSLCKLDAASCIFSSQSQELVGMICTLPNVILPPSIASTLVSRSY